MDKQAMLRRLSRQAKAISVKSSPEAKRPKSLKISALQALEYGFSPKEVAKAAGVSTGSIYSWRRDKSLKVKKLTVSASPSRQTGNSRIRVAIGSKVSLEIPAELLSSTLLANLSQL